MPLNKAADYQLLLNVSNVETFRIMEEPSKFGNKYAGKYQVYFTKG